MFFFIYVPVRLKKKYIIFQWSLLVFTQLNAEIIKKEIQKFVYKDIIYFVLKILICYYFIIIFIWWFKILWIKTFLI